MQRIGSLLVSQIIVLLFVGSYAWSHQAGASSNSDGDNYDSLKRPLYSFGTYKRLPSYDFGLGKRSLEEPASYEDSLSFPSGPSALVSPEMYYNAENDKRAPGNMYSFGLGKRNRAYGFGLGKRLEQAWKTTSPGNFVPSYSRQERRSKIYSFGLGKRSGVVDMYPSSDYYDGSYNDNKRANAGRQFSFGLGKREAVDDAKSHPAAAAAKDAADAAATGVDAATTTS